MKKISPSSYVLVAVVLTISSAMFPRVSRPAEQSLRVPARVERSDATRLVFRIEIPSHRLDASQTLRGAFRLEVDGFAMVGDAGKPAVPSRRFLVALPPEGTYSLSYRSLATEELGSIQLEPKPFLEAGDDGGEMGKVVLERYAIEPEVYESYVDPPLVEVLEPVYLRRNRVLPIRVNPIRHDPATGKTTLVTVIEVEVRFRSEILASPPRPVRESPMWEGLLSRTIVNAKQARSWREPRRARAATGLTSRLAAAHRLLRLEVRRTGIHRVRASVLIGEGFPSGVPIADLHLFQRTYDDDNLVPGVQDIAFLVVEDPGGTSGLFDGGDHVIFYGRDLRDDAARGDRIKKYSHYNVYWLGDDGGPSMSTRPTVQGYITADTSSAFFARLEHFEDDVIFNEFTHPSAGTDFNVFNWGFEKSIDYPFYLPALKPGSMVHLAVDLRGRLYKLRVSTLRINNSSGTTNLTTSFSLPNRDRRVYETDVTATAFVVGLNRFQATSTRSNIDMHLNSMQVSFEALFRARNNTLRFNTFSLSGDTSVTVTGLQSTDHFLFDITDANAPVLVDISNRFTDVGDNFAMSIRVDADANRDYIIIPENRMTTLTQNEITRDTPSAIIGDPAENGVDVLVIAHGLFIATMRNWVTYRRAQGYRVLMVDVEDTYDEFNNGIPGTRGVYRFIRHFYEYGGAGTVLLVGDASEDAKTLHDDSAPNFVPTFSHAEHIAALSEDEVVTTDKTYVKMPVPGGFVDNEPDMVIGRIPAGTTNELIAVLFKVFQFERPDASESWRRRVIVISDDEFSSGASAFGGFQLCEKGAERRFQSSQEIVARKFENSAAGFDVTRVYLHDLFEAAGSYPPRPATGAWCWGQFTAVQAARSVANPVLMAELAKGASFVTIQSHMNRSQVGHEIFFTTLSGSATGSTGQDHLNISNNGRPFVLFALGCHFNDYALHREQALSRTNANKPNGDSFGEQLLFANNKGAVGVIGSSGYEYLNETNQYMEMTTSVWLYEAPYENLITQTQAQWKLGEITFLAEAAIPQVGPIGRYHLLGDPLLRIDAGPPGFDVTVDGNPIENGDWVKSVDSDTISVVAIITDENAIHDFTLTIAGVPMNDSLTVEKIGDVTVPNGRQYRVSFRHVLRAEAYSIVLGALQAPDTSGAYGIDARFEMIVPADVSLTVNNRPVGQGDIVAARGDYVVDLFFAVAIEADDIVARIDGIPRPDAEASLIVPGDLTGWRVTFFAELENGEHTLQITVGTIELGSITFFVSSEAGIRNVINFPNPFVDDTYFFFTNDVQISEGTVDVYTTSGRRIRRLVIPPLAMTPGENSVYWNGRDGSGDEIANGVYLFIIKVRQNGEWNTFRGKLARMH